MDPFRHDNGYYPPHQSYGYPQAPPHGYPPHQSYGYPQAPPLVVNYNYNYAMPPNYNHVMHPGYPNAMPPTPPGYPNAMPPTLPGYPYNPTPGTYPIYQPWENHWQPPEARPECTGKSGMEATSGEHGGVTDNAHRTQEKTALLR